MKITMKSVLDDSQCCKCDDADCTYNHKEAIVFRPTKITRRDRKFGKVSPEQFKNTCSHCYLLQKYQIVDGEISVFCGEAGKETCLRWVKKQKEVVK